MVIGMRNAMGAMRSYLASALDVPVYVTIPKEPKAPFVSISTTGGNAGGTFDSVEIAVQSWGNSVAEAYELCASVADTLKGSFIEVDGRMCPVTGGKYVQNDNADVRLHRYLSVWYVNVAG